MSDTYNRALVALMASQLHAAPDAEDEATAFVCAAAISEWVLSREVRDAALAGVNKRAKFAGGSLSYGGTVAAVLSAVADEARKAARS